jgi:hypothetical protein
MEKSNLLEILLIKLASETEKQAKIDQCLECDG